MSEDNEDFETVSCWKSKAMEERNKGKEFHSKLLMVEAELKLLRSKLSAATTEQRRILKSLGIF